MRQVLVVRVKAAVAVQVEAAAARERQKVAVGEEGRQAASPKRPKLKPWSAPTPQSLHA